MAKRFDIHEWQAKQRLAEQDDFTPDLEDDELKRGAIRQMMDKEKPKTPQDVSQGTLNKAVEDLAKIYSYGEILDSLKVFYTDTGEQPYADMAKKHAKEFRDFLDNDDEGFPFGAPLAGFPELDEQNSLGAAGAGTSITTGDSDAIATPRAFAKSKKSWENRTKKMKYTEQEEPEGEKDQILDPSKMGKDGELESDSVKVNTLIQQLIGNREEWEEVLYLLIQHGFVGEAGSLNNAQIKTILINTAKEL